MVPLISSGALGPLGICQAPRFWWKVALWNAGHLDAEYFHCSQGLDTWLLEDLGLDKERTLDYLSSKRPRYRDFESWIEDERGPLDPGTKLAFNRRIWTRQFPADTEHGRRKMAETYGDIGLAADAGLHSASLLNCLQDWQLHFRRDRDDPLFQTLPNLISFRDYGTTGLMGIPTLWQSLLTGKFGPPNDLESRLLAAWRSSIGPDELRSAFDESDRDFLSFEAALARHEIPASGYRQLEANREILSLAGELSPTEWQSWDDAWALLQG